MSASMDFLKAVKRAEIARISEIITMHTSTGVSSGAPKRVLTSDQLDREKADKEDLSEVSQLKHDSMVTDACTMLPIYEAMRARRDINIGRASRIQRLAAGLTTMNKRMRQLEYDVSRG